jgi:hypothetical protein
MAEAPTEMSKNISAVLSDYYSIVSSIYAIDLFDLERA